MNRQEQFIMEQRERTTQVRIKDGHIVDGFSPGTVVWMTPKRAQMFMDMGVIEIIGAPKAPGPDEIKPAEPSAKKSSDAPSTGPLIGSASSSEPGREPSLSASEEARASSESRSSTFEDVGSAAEHPSASSLSTTPISSRPSRTSSTSQTPRGGAGTAKPRRSRSSRG